MPQDLALRFARMDPLPLTTPLLRPAALSERITSRRRRPWLAMVAAPLATTAAVLTSQWFALLPLGFSAWWWSPTGGNWLIAAETSWLGAGWAMMGTSAFSAWPRSRLLVGSLWASSAAAWAAASAHNRRAHAFSH